MSHTAYLVGLKRFGLLVIAVAVGLLTATASNSAQTPTRAMVESHIKAIVAAYTARDAESIVRLDPAAPGFGFRTLQARQADRPYLEALNTFFANLDYYRIELNELQTYVDGDNAVAWGFWTEDFKERGRNPENIRVRFSFTLRHDGSGWQTLFYHRDIQKFDERGAYLRGP